MEGEGLRLLLQRLDREPPLFFAEEARAAFGPSLDGLRSSGLLVAARPATVVACGGCGGGHAACVEYLRDRRTGRPRAYLPCPECGPVEVPAEDLCRWAVDVPGFLS